MTDKKVTALASTSAVTASDWGYMVDVSDTTDSASGTSKKYHPTDMKTVSILDQDGVSGTDWTLGSDVLTGNWGYLQMKALYSNASGFILDGFYDFAMVDPNDTTPPAPPDGTGTYGVSMSMLDYDKTYTLSAWGYWGSDLFQWGSECRNAPGSFYTTISTGNGGIGPPRHPGYRYNLWYTPEGGQVSSASAPPLGLTWIRDGGTFRISKDGTDKDSLYLQYKDGTDTNESDWVEQWYGEDDRFHIKGTNATNGSADMQVDGFTKIYLNGEVEGRTIISQNTTTSMSADYLHYVFVNPTSTASGSADKRTGFVMRSTADGDFLNLRFKGSTRWRMDKNGFGGGGGLGPVLRNELPSTTNPTLLPNWADLKTGVGWKSSTELSLVVVEAEAARFEDPAALAATETSLWLYDDDAGTIRQVTVSSADTAGTGFRALRIANV